MTTINSSKNSVLSAPPAGGILATIPFVHFDHPTAGALRSPAVFDSVIIAGRHSHLRFYLFAG